MVQRRKLSSFPRSSQAKWFRACILPDFIWLSFVPLFYRGMRSSSEYYNWTISDWTRSVLDSTASSWYNTGCRLSNVSNSRNLFINVSIIVAVLMVPIASFSSIACTLHSASLFFQCNECRYNQTQNICLLKKILRCCISCDIVICSHSFPTCHCMSQLSYPKSPKLTQSF
jgi:hypothetical protein